MNRLPKPDETANSGPPPAGNPPASDAELARAARRGDKRAFVEIVARHQAMVCGIALGILGDFAASEDAAQEAFLTAWRKIHELREPDRLRGWLGQVSRRAALGHLRRQRAYEPLDDNFPLADESPTPDEATAHDEEAALVRESLTKLPETYRLPLVLYYREGQSVRVVAETLGLSEDAVKQRLARGREMLRDRMSGLIETVLTRTGPTPVFTMTIAAAIGALAAPAAVAGSVFAAASVGGAGATSTSAAACSPVLTSMSTSKTFLITAAFATAVCIPVGYYANTEKPPAAKTHVTSRAAADVSRPAAKAAPSFESSWLFAEWRRLHDLHGTNSAAMPALYRAIAGLDDPFRRRAFRATLIAEWVQVDAPGGLKFMLGQGPDAGQRRQFLEEWLAHDAGAAVDALWSSGPGWEGMARDCLPELARRAPARVPDIASRLPKSDGYWDTKVRDAFAILAEHGVSSARSAADGVTGASHDQALAGVALTWARSDLQGAIAWARTLPDGTDRDEIIRAALLGKAVVDPAAALELAGTVPSGGRYAHANSTTGGRVLIEAAKTDFDATVAWLAAHSGRFGREDLMGLSQVVTERLNADAAGFLTKHAEEGSLAILGPAIESAILNRASGQQSAIWEWLKIQPDNATIQSLKEHLLSSAGYQDPELALRLVADLPRTPDGDAQVQQLAQCLFNGGYQLHRFDKLLEQAPERMRQPLIDAAFGYLNPTTMTDPQPWIARLPQLPEASRARATESIARAWAQQAPEEAIGWVAALGPGETRTGAVAAIASGWAKQDAAGAAGWIAAMTPGIERDRSAESLVLEMAEKYPREAWEWALSINDGSERSRAATHAAKTMAARDPATARQWIETGPFTPEVKAELRAAVASASQSKGAR